MAYLRPLTRTCDKCKDRKATVELITRLNDLYGYYCTACGNRTLKELEKLEQNTPITS